MKTLTREDINEMQWPVWPGSTRWHEGTQVVGYWPEGDSFVFKGNQNVHLCVSRGFIEKIARGEIDFDDETSC